MNLNNLKPADRLVIPKSDLRLVQHHVIYLGIDKLGRKLFLENAIGKGVQIISENSLFKETFNLTRIEQFIGNDSQRTEAVNYAKSMIGKQYDLLNFNCEHYANIVQHKRSYSNQTSNAVMLVGLLLILGIVLSNNQ